MRKELEKGAAELCKTREILGRVAMLDAVTSQPNSDPHDAAWQEWSAEVRTRTWAQRDFARGEVLLYAWLHAYATWQDAAQELCSAVDPPLSVPEFNVLMCVRDFAPLGIRLADLATVLVVSYPSISGLVVRMEKRRLVARKNGRVIITDRGAQALRGPREVFLGFVDRLFDGIIDDPQHRSRLLGDFLRIQQNILRLVGDDGYRTAIRAAMSPAKPADGPAQR